MLNGPKGELCPALSAWPGLRQRTRPGENATDVAYPTPKDIRAIVDYALAHGWDPTAAGGQHELGPEADLEVPGFRITGQARP